MLTIRRGADRGHFNHGWLDTFHTFSFGDYYDPAHMQFGPLRVINEDRVAPGQGFGMHGHRDMEIVTYVLSGALEHRDSLGNGEVLRPGELQRMTAGTGIRHSEFNPSATEPVHLYQIWLLPERQGLEPSYEQKAIPRRLRGKGPGNSWPRRMRPRVAEDPPGCAALPGRAEGRTVDRAHARARPSGVAASAARRGRSRRRAGSLPEMPWP